MAEEPNWGKRGVIAAYVIGLPTIALALLAYFVPPDPAHPMRFDFLTQNIVLPPWIAVLIPLVLIATTTIIVRHRAIRDFKSPEELKQQIWNLLKQLTDERNARANADIELSELRSQQSEEQASFKKLLQAREKEIDSHRKAMAEQKDRFERERDKLKGELATAQLERATAFEVNLRNEAELQTLHKSIEQMKRDVHVTPAKMLYPEPTDAVKAYAISHAQENNQTTEFSVSSPDDFAIRISRKETATTKGLMLVVSNNGLNAIGKTRLIVRSARSFNSQKGAFRDGRTFIPLNNTDTRPIEASCSGLGMWFIQKNTAHHFLLVGNDDQHPAIWPENDSSPIQKWLLSFEVCALTTPQQQSTEGHQLEPIKASVVVTWDSSTNELFIEPAPDQH